MARAFTIASWNVEHFRGDPAIRAIRFRRTLDDAGGGQANYIFLGNLNSMGMDYSGDRDITADQELGRWNYRARRYYDMHIC